jgi:hypothetical protein
VWVHRLASCEWSRGVDVARIVRVFACFKGGPVASMWQGSFVLWFRSIVMFQDWSVASMWQGSFECSCGGGSIVLHHEWSSRQRHEPVVIVASRAILVPWRLKLSSLHWHESVVIFECPGARPVIDVWRSQLFSLQYSCHRRVHCGFRRVRSPCSDFNPGPIQSSQIHGLVPGLPLGAAVLFSPKP